MGRLETLQSRIAEHGWDALLVSRPADVRYLTGARGTRTWLMLTPREAMVIAHYVDLEQTRIEAQGLPLRRAGQIDGIAEIVDQAHIWGVRALACNAESMAHAYFELLTGELGKRGVRLLADEGIVRRMRWVKDAAEVALVRRATEINDLAYRAVLPILKPGVTERQVAQAVQQMMYDAGVEAIPFLAVQFGEHSALPHYYPTPQPLRSGDFVLMDWVVQFEGYMSDVTRTVVASEPNARQREVYELVHAAQIAGLQAVRPGITGHAADAAARAIIEAAGFGSHFGHSLGHGINEGPSLDQGSPDVLEPGMIVTVEPGIYIPGWGGVRIEDTVVITLDGCEALPRTPKELVCV